MNLYKSGALQKKKKALFLMTIVLGLLINSNLSLAKDATFYFQEGQSLEEQGRYNEALAAFDKAIELNPKNLYPYVIARGNLKFKQGALKEALADFNRATELDPRNPYPYIFKGNIKFQQGDLMGALVAFDKVIELDPKNPYPYIVRGNIKFQQGAPNGALADFNRAIELDPNEFIFLCKSGGISNPNRGT